MKQLSDRNIICIVNPISGGIDKSDFNEIIQDFANKHSIEIRIIETKHKGHIDEILSDLKGIDTVISIGGDGTVSEISKKLINNEVDLLIVPCGSGNGFAQHFYLPNKLSESLQLLNSGTTKSIDTGLVNDQIFVSNCGVGFEAEVALAFDGGEKRGLKGYRNQVLKLYFKSKEKIYKIKTSHSNFEVKAHMLCIANTKFFGNQFCISPKSDAEDGKLELVAIEKYNWIELPKNLNRFFNQKINESNKHTVRSIKSLEINGDFSHFQADGSPFKCGGKVSVSIIEKSLSIIVPNN